MVRLPSKSTLFPYTTLFRSSATLLAAILGMLGLARTAVKRRSSPRHRSGTTRISEGIQDLRCNDPLWKACVNGDGDVPRETRTHSATRSEERRVGKESRERWS